MNIKRYLYLTLGFVCVGLAYIGFVTPGIPFSIFLVIAAWAFAKSSKRMEAWLYNHPWFGAFLTNWVNKRVFPQKGKYAMILVMSSIVSKTSPSFSGFIFEKSSHFPGSRKWVGE